MMRRVAFLFVSLALLTTSPAFAQALDIKLQHQLLPTAAKFVFINKGSGLMYYQGLSQDKTLVGVVFAASGQGYNGPIEAAASMSPSGEILAIKIIRHEETAGLGAGVAEFSFLDQFLRKKPGEFDSIQAVSGATVSSAAVVKMVRERAEAILKDLQ